MNKHLRPPLALSTIEQTLQRLAAQFTVRDIMVPSANLVKAKTLLEARKHLEIHDNFNIIPIESENQITDYVERGREELKPISLDLVIGNGCSILDLVDVLVDRQFCFVTGKHGVEGFVHFSDLNHNLVDLPFYVLLQAVEAHVASLIGATFNEANLQRVFDGYRPGFVKRIVDRYEKSKSNDADRSLLNEVNLKTMLSFACYFKLLDLTDKEICQVSAVRDSISHVPEKLINKHGDVNHLRLTKDLCHKILSNRSSA